MQTNNVFWNVTIKIGYADATATFDTAEEAIKFTDMFINAFGKEESTSITLNPVIVIDDEDKEKEDK